MPATDSCACGLYYRNTTQAVLRCVLGTLTAADPASIPRIEVPLHTLLEVVMFPDGTVTCEALPADLALGVRAAESTGAVVDGAQAGAALASPAPGGGGGAARKPEQQRGREQPQIRVAVQAA
jgi:hypothetical protein